MRSDVVIDGLQYNNWDRALFQKTRDGGVHVVHVTVSYWEDFRETLLKITQWHRHFVNHGDLIMPVKTAADVLEAQRSNRLGIVFGFQNCSPINDDLGLVQVLHELGARFMQLSYNNQSLLATGCYEDDDPGITRFGKQVIQEMNRVGMVIDMSHSAERSTLHAIELSSRPIAVTHANPAFFHPALRNKSNTVIDALAESGGMLGLSLYPFHLKNGSACTLQSFCEMIEQTVERIGIDQLGIGSDLCQNWGYDTLEWMRSGRWTFVADHGRAVRRINAGQISPSGFKAPVTCPISKRALHSGVLAKSISTKSWVITGSDFLKRHLAPPQPQTLSSPHGKPNYRSFDPRTRCHWGGL